MVEKYHKYEKQWFDKLRKLLENPPNDKVWLFVNSSITLLRKDKDGDIVLEEYGSPDQAYILDGIDPKIYCDGGGW